MMTESQWNIVCAYLRQKLGNSDKVVVNANAMKRDLCLPDDYYQDFAKFAARPGRDFAFDMTTAQTESEPWEYVIIPARVEV